MNAESRDDPGGQHRAAGNTLMGLGGAAVMVGLVAAIVHLELRFIDARMMAVFGLVMAGAGVWQWASAERLGR